MFFTELVSLIYFVFMHNYKTPYIAEQSTLPYSDIQAPSLNKIWIYQNKNKKELGHFPDLFYQLHIIGVLRSTILLKSILHAVLVTMSH